MVMLQNVCENWVRILEEEKHRQLRMFAILWKKVKETGIPNDKPKREKAKTMRTPENIAAVAINLPLFSTIEHFGDIIKTNFA